MGGLCSSASQPGGAPFSGQTPLEVPELTLDDFDEDQRKFVGQLAKLSSRSAAQIKYNFSSDKNIGKSSKPDLFIDPIVAKEFVNMAKAIKGRQHSLMKQIIQLALLMDLSIASLNKAIVSI